MCENSGPPTKTGNLYLFTKFPEDVIHHLEVLAKLFFRQFGLKMPIHARKIGRSGIGSPQWAGQPYQRDPQRHSCDFALNNVLID